MPATTTLLGLVTPTQGTLSGTWGDTVNYGISDYVDIAIAGTLTFTGDGAVTLANTTGSASGNGFTTTTAQYMVIRIIGTQTVTKVITGPSYSKLYMVDHAGATSAVTFKAAGQTGVTVAVGEKCFVYYNGTDYVKVATSAIAAGGSNTQVQFNSSGALAGSANLTFNGTTLTAAGFSGPLNGTVGATTASTGAFTTLSATGVTTVQAGSAAAPAITTTGDTNTGIFFPAADTIAFAEGGVESMRIDASGNLGLGVTPSAQFSTVRALQIGQGAILEGRTNGPNMSVGANFYLDSSATYRYTSTDFASRYTQATGAHLWYTAPSGTAGDAITFTQAVTLDASGNLLVGGTAARGTTVGTAHLDLFNGTAPAGTLTNGVSLYSSSGDLRFMDAAGSAYSVGYRNVPQSGSSKTTSYTLATTDVGEYILLGASGAIVIPDATFAAGDVVSIFNNTASTATITCSITTAYIAGTFTDKATMTLAAAGVATVLFITSTLCVVSGNVT